MNLSINNNVTNVSGSPGPPAASIPLSNITLSNAGMSNLDPAQLIAMVSAAASQMQQAVVPEEKTAAPHSKRNCSEDNVN